MCPYLSWMNPAERLMSTLNLALQNVSLMREEMDDAFEKAVKNKNNIAEIRSANKGKPELEEAVLKSMAPVVKLLDEHFARMKLKGYAIRVAPAASQDDIVDNFEPVHFLNTHTVELHCH